MSANSTRRPGADAWKKFLMPTYQYACTNADCANRFDLVQSFTDPAATQCPVCGSAVRKVFSPVGVVFKGSGFYRNDSRSEPKTETKSAGSAGSDGAGSGANKDAAASAPSGGKDGSSTKPDSSSTSRDTAAAKQPSSGSSASSASSGSAGSAGSSAGKTAASA